MKIFRPLLLALLSFAISIQGYAHIALPERPCPMHQPDALATITLSAAHDCCNDADTFAKTGKACKTGQECPAGCSGPITSFQTVSIAPVAALRLVSRPQARLDFAPAGVWRPPTSL